jgi:hypothetical protein
MPEGFRPQPLTLVAVVVCTVAIGAPNAAPAAERPDRENARRLAARGVPVRVINDASIPLPVVNIGPGDAGYREVPLEDFLITSITFPGTEESSAVSLPAVQDWLVLEVEVVPLPAVDTQKPPAAGCLLEAQVPKEEVNPNSTESTILSVGWSGLDFRSVHRPLAIPLKRQLGERIELLLQAVGGDGSVRSPCRAKVVLRGVIR